MKKLALTALALSLLGEQAFAATMKAEYQGSVYSGFDQSGYFGVQGQNLASKSVLLTYVYDTAGGYHVDNRPVYDEVYGYSSAQPMISATVTLNGVTRTIYDNYYGHAVIYGLATYSGGVHQASELTVNPTVYKYNDSYSYLLAYYNTGIEANLEKPFELQIGSAGGGYFSFYDEDRVHGGIQSAYGYFTPFSLKVTRLDTPAAVPLPSSGSLFLVMSLFIAVLKSRKARPNRAYDHSIPEVAIAI